MRKSKEVRHLRRAKVALGLLGPLLVTPHAALGQATPKLEFEVATVRPSGPQSTGPAAARQSRSGGAGTNDPERLIYTLMPFYLLLWDAYGVRSDLIVGPDWVYHERFDIVAKVPLGATRAEQELMLRNLLIERFHMSVGQEAREMPSYVLTVAKGGPKFRESAVDPGVNPLPPGVAPGPACRAGRDQDGFPKLAPGCSGQLELGGTSSRSVRMTAQKVPLASLVGALTRFLDVSTARIIDETGLTGNYDYRLSFSGTGLNANANANQDPTGLPDLFGALEQQLGLKLDKKKLLINVVIVDHADRVPAEN